nr:T9SS type A sorting domain-containing protein [uncultured Draconibacterium sp.]
MDFNDADPTTIFLDANYEEVTTPSATGPDSVCTSGGIFTLKNLPTGFSASWSLSHPSLFNGATNGSGTSATIYPKSQYSGDECYITFTISDACGSAQYKKYFYINGPADSEIDINVVPSNAPTPVRVSGIWLLCPNSTYYIYCTNTSDCSLSNYQWSYPSGWTKYEQTSNYIRINTNSTPYGTVTVSATTCCGTSHQVITQNFSQGGPCSYFLAYPNPATTELTLEFNEEFDMETIDATTSIEIYDSGFTKKYKAKKIEKKMKVRTAGWKEGFYYVILNYRGQKYYEKIKVE